MAGYDKTNFAQVENSAAKFGLPATQDSRFATNDVACERIGLGMHKLAPGSRIGFGHCHTNAEEVYVVVAGSGRARFDDEIVQVEQWDVLRVDPKTVRSFEGGPAGLEVLAFGERSGAEGSEIFPDFWTD